MRDDAYIVMQGPVLRVFFAILMRSTKDFATIFRDQGPQGPRGVWPCVRAPPNLASSHSRASRRCKGGTRGGGDSRSGSAQQRRWAQREERGKEEKNMKGRRKR